MYTLNEVRIYDGKLDNHDNSHIHFINILIEKLLTYPQKNDH